MRQKIHQLFGYKIADDESIIAYLRRIDKFGQLDLLKIIELIGILFDRHEATEIELKELRALVTTKPVETPPAPAQTFVEQQKAHSPVPPPTTTQVAMATDTSKKAI